MIIVPTIPAHFEGFVAQKEQMVTNKYIQDPSYVPMLCEAGLSWSGIVDGKVIAMAGVYEVHKHIGMVWAILGEGSEKHMLAMTRAIKNWLDNWDCARLETAVRVDFYEGHRWAKMLGFENETPKGMKKFGTDGETCCLYARVK